MVNVDKIIDDLIDIQNNSDYIKNDYNHVKDEMLQILNNFYIRIKKLTPEFKNLKQKQKDVISDVIDDVKSVQDAIEDKNWVQKNMMNLLSVICDIDKNLKELVE